MQLLDDTWYHVSNVAKAKGENTYLLTITAGTPTIEISGDGGATSVTLSEASTAAPSAHALVLSRNLLIKSSGGATVQLT